MSAEDLTRLFAAAPFDRLDARRVAATARALKQAEREHAAGVPPLRDRNVALICSRPDADGAREFSAAAAALGARVSRIEPEAAWLHGELADAPQTARLLGRLYDAIDCEGVPERFARQLRDAVGVPVFDGLARRDHPLAELLPALADDGLLGDAADQRFLVQAALLHAMRAAA